MRAHTPHTPHTHTPTHTQSIHTYIYTHTHSFHWLKDLGVTLFMQCTVLPNKGISCLMSNKRDLIMFMLSVNKHQWILLLLKGYSHLTSVTLFLPNFGRSWTSIIPYISTFILITRLLTTCSYHSSTDEHSLYV